MKDKDRIEEAYAKYEQGQGAMYRSQHDVFIAGATYEQEQQQTVIADLIGQFDYFWELLHKADDHHIKDHHTKKEEVGKSISNETYLRLQSELSSVQNLMKEYRQAEKDLTDFLAKPRKDVEHVNLLTRIILARRKVDSLLTSYNTLKQKE